MVAIMSALSAHLVGAAYVTGRIGGDSADARSGCEVGSVDGCDGRTGAGADAQRPTARTGGRPSSGARQP
jgi:hypothetical protein